MPGYDRSDRFNEEIKRGMTEILRGEVKDPRVPELISVTRVEASKDLSVARIYVSAMTDERQAKDMMRFFKDAAGFLRHKLGEKVQLRQLPELQFIHDRNIEYGARIAEVLEGIKAPGEDGDA